MIAALGAIVLHRQIKLMTLKKQDMKKINLLLALLLIMNTSKLFAQSFNYPLTFAMSADATVFGPQGRIACDIKMPEKYEIGLSFAYAGLVASGDRNTLVFSQNDYRINASIRALQHFDLSRWAKPFVTAQVGISYNKVENFILQGGYLPSFRFGAGMDFHIIKSAGLRVEAGFGSPYFGSAGLFFKL